MRLFNYKKIIWFKKKVLSNLEPEGQGCGIIIGVTHLLLLAPFYYIHSSLLGALKLVESRALPNFTALYSRYDTMKPIFLEFKLDDTRLSYWHKNVIGRIELFLLLPDFANFLSCLPVSVLLTQPTGQKISKVRKQQK